MRGSGLLMDSPVKSKLPRKVTRLHAGSVVDELAGGAGAGVLDDIDGHLLDGVAEAGAATLAEANEVGTETGDVWGGHGGT